MTKHKTIVGLIGMTLLAGAACTDRGGTGVDEPDGGVALSACAEAMDDAPLAPADYPATDALATANRNAWDGQSMPAANDSAYPGGKYRTIEPDVMGNRHPGCSTAGLSYTPASIPGYACAAKQYPFPAGATEDTSKPIVILVHGNSDSPVGWEAFVHADPESLEFPADTEPRPQLAERLPALGYRTIAVDLRTDLVDDPADPGGEPTSPNGNTPKNMDHGWATPLVQDIIRRVADANPGRQISVVGFSLGATVVRDAVRRLYVDYRLGAWDTNVFGVLRDVIVASGAHHGVSSHAAYCGSNLTMRGEVTCEMGQRNQYSQTEFHRPLNGPAMPTANGEFGGWYETPCADGDYAFGERGVCDGNAVDYTTIAMADNEDDSQEDLFVSEHASRLYPPECANNVVTNNDVDFDTSAYFLNGFFRNHYGAVRSEAGLNAIVGALGD